MTPWVVYGIVSRRTGQTLYVGITSRPSQRWATHRSTLLRGHAQQYDFRELWRGPEKAARIHERLWIDAYLQRGERLRNTVATDGHIAREWDDLLHGAHWTAREIAYTYATTRQAVHATLRRFTPVLIRRARAQGDARRVAVLQRPSVRWMCEQKGKA